MQRVLGLLLLLMLLIGSIAYASTVTVAWDFTHDGVNNVTRFKLNFSENCGGYPLTYVAPVASSTGTFTQQYTLTTLKPKTVYCLSAVSLTEAGTESGASSLMKLQTQ